jgi:hypothetical protein
MGDLVNLRRARKDRARREREKTADENRVEFGRRKGERAMTDALMTLQETRLSAQKLDRPAPMDDDDA